MCTLFLNFSTVFVVSHQCLDNQQFLLLELKNTLIFESTLSAKLAKWNQSVDCCSWEGVTCNEGRVIGLDLSSESILGGLGNSSSLFSFKHLQSLSLAYNDFNNSHIPPQFGKLVNLSYLNLSNAGFAGQIPLAISRLTRLVTLDLSTTYYYIYQLKLENPNLNVLVQKLSELIELYLDGVLISAQGNEWGQALSSSLPNLRVLSLSKCNLSGPIDSSLQNLQSLSIIDLSRNNLSAPVPDFFADFKNLTSLDFYDCELNGKFPEKIFQVPTLQTLFLSFNYRLEVSLPEFLPNGSLRDMALGFTNFSGSLPPSIGNLKMLSRIDLAQCNFNGSIPDSIVSLTQLVNLDLSDNNFNGSIPDSIASLTQLVILDLSYNNFTGSIPGSIGSLTQLVFLGLSYNNFHGSIPDSIASLTQLVILDLSYNNFTGSIPGSIGSLTQLVSLDLSYNNFTGSISGSIGSLTQLLYVFLSNNNFNGSIPNFGMFKNLTSLLLGNNHLSGQINSTQWEELLNLDSLDLSGNSLNGNIPISLFPLPSWQELDLSHNQFSGSLDLTVIQNVKSISELDLSYNNLLVEFNSFNISLTSFPQLSYLGLASCKLKVFPDFLRNQSSLQFLDLSNNQIYGEIPASISQSLANTFFLSLSSNKLYGSIPRSICKATNLQLLDLSNNSFSGTIPQCLIKMSRTLGVLNLRTNNLNGTIPDAFPDNCGLHTLYLNKNQLEGGLPKSLANCKRLEVLDIGNNHIKGTFPFYLKNTSMLRVLVLRSNKFYGSITHPEPNATWPMLQIIDVASNNFTGNLPITLLLTWMAMMNRSQEAQSRLSYLETQVAGIYYRDMITVTIKGLMVELKNILEIFTTIDFSCNGFDGPIPKEMGELKVLHILNLSHNAFTGQIPSSLGKLTNLESLDLSSNKLSGKIPMQIADGLIFLSVLNLSFNQLEGKIPFIKQFATFLETSFEGNERLCGIPLKSHCTYEEPQLSPPTYEEKHWNSGIVIEWNYISIELGFIFGIGIIIGPLMFWKRWRIWYYKHVDDILFRIFPRLYLGKEYHKKCIHGNQRRRHKS
ncbi:receptor-like protein 35 [Corylus avellana]|uniref:receptor-like protein 35 n=1 Tax=Corylus avellana TaxID=13451 RepID=UPI00286BCF69|nr:receptor-like protein 35 [Corylus avellana]